LTLKPDRSVVVSVPRRTSHKEAVRFLSEQGEWLAKHIGTSKKKRKTLLGHLEKRPWLSICGVESAVNFGFTRVKSRITHVGDDNRVDLKLNASHPVDWQLKSLLKALAKDAIRNRVAQLADRIGVRIARVGVRDQTRCWGSCSHRRTLSFNWRLLLLTPKLHDYIIFHELAHLAHMNHSDGYWELLARYDPEAKRNDARLSKVSEDLMSLGRDPA